MKVKVEQRHIDKAKKLWYNGTRSKSCPIALAVKEKQHKPVRVYNNYVAMDSGKGLLTYDLPTIAQAFILDFDREYPVLPFEFEMERS